MYTPTMPKKPKKIKAMSQVTYDGELCEEIPFDEKINFMNASSNIISAG